MLARAPSMARRRKQVGSFGAAPVRPPQPDMVVGPGGVGWERFYKALVTFFILALPVMAPPDAFETRGAFHGVLLQQLERLTELGELIELGALAQSRAGRNRRQSQNQ